MLEEKFQLDTGSFKIEENESKADFEKRISLVYAGSDLKDEWVISN